jgi:DNA polymerase-3 subunit epsilon
MREIVFDTETTGLSPRDGDRVIEIGAIELINHFPSGKIYHVFINPEDRKVDPGAFNVHGISNDFLKDKPLFKDIATEFLEFFSEGNLIAHNAGFDMGFLNSELARLDIKPIANDRVIDTLQIARRKHPAGPNSLDALCSRYNIDNSHRTKHGALLDSELLAEVYLELIGGRQAALGLGEAEDQTAIAPTIGSSAKKPQTRRPSPLHSRLSETEQRAHSKFVDSIGDNAIWKRI